MILLLFKFRHFLQFRQIIPQIFYNGKSAFRLRNSAKIFPLFAFRVLGIAFVYIHIIIQVFNFIRYNMIFIIRRFVIARVHCKIFQLENKFGYLFLGLVENVNNCSQKNVTMSIKSKISVFIFCEH
ncbi:hypothetical protein BpHYR1_047234 [Brachionus plicatilis]|uniref:Uncharacterized protein n=1 Tax=Brachionus plicatilis TaxID=10195 RepID=A0A3M7QRZ4_BRAPC|nr:hypothetical protein BpHYR1_047234 [Brachionus plicatilis]